jgi:mono/diheme cytochrome c family protein
MKIPITTIIAGVVCAAGLLAGNLPARGRNGSAEKKPSKAAGDVARGKAQFKGNCVICHFEASDKKKVGPGLKGFGARTTFADGTKITDARLHDVIINGGKDMPPFLGIVNDAQIRDLISYLKTL